MIHIEIQSLDFALLIAPFGWHDITNDVKRGPAFRVRFGRALFGNWRRKEARHG